MSIHPQNTNFRDGLLDPDSDTPQELRGPHQSSAVKRYAVYRNNVTSSLVNALADIYPATQAIVGVPFFRAMARTYARANPPKSPLLYRFGDGLADFITSFEPTQKLPYLADVARIERAWLDAYHAADTQALTPQTLSAFDQTRLGEARFKGHPAARLIHSDFAAGTIFQMNRNLMPLTQIDLRKPEAVLLTRPHLDVATRVLKPEEAAFIGTLLENAPLGEAAENALSINASFDISHAIRLLLESGAVEDAIE